MCRIKDMQVGGHISRDLKESNCWSKGFVNGQDMTTSCCLDQGRRRAIARIYSVGVTDAFSR